VIKLQHKVNELAQSQWSEACLPERQLAARTVEAEPRRIPVKVNHTHYAGAVGGLADGLQRQRTAVRPSSKSAMKPGKSASQLSLKLSRQSLSPAWERLYYGKDKEKSGRDRAPTIASEHSPIQVYVKGELQQRSIGPRCGSRQSMKHLQKETFSSLRKKTS